MTRWFLKRKTTVRNISLSGVLAVVLPVLMGAASGCDIGEKQYTILLHAFTGPNHVGQSKMYRDKTKELAGWSGLELVHKDSNSELYWGRYRTASAAETDLKTARTWRVQNVNRPAFPFPKVVLIPGMEIERPEYNLANASPGYWTVLVALYVDDPSQGFVGRDRQKHALEYCDWLRKKGYEAYYRHTSSRTQITVGTFPEHAFVLESKTGRGSSIIPAKQIAAKQVVKSERMKKIMHTVDPPLRYLLINDHAKGKKQRLVKTGKIVSVITGSYPIPIPGRQSSHDRPSHNRGESGINERPSNVPERDSSRNR